MLFSIELSEFIPRCNFFNVVIVLQLSLVLTVRASNILPRRLRKIQNVLCIIHPACSVEGE